ncbi:hypothetical protein GGR56DRAFT_365593 [Xylariaceae sp. FL0804]|nr:hypothetical protein GGR56DRAFT_365593 [Xylariaceae sp. FL0804]
MAPPRGQVRFQTDLAAAVEQKIRHIFDIKKGDAENEFVFTYRDLDASLPSELEISVMPEDLSSYPADHVYIVYATQDVPTEVATVLQNSVHVSRGKRVGDMLEGLSQRLHSALSVPELDGDGDSTMLDAETDDSNVEDSEDEFEDFEYDDDIDAFGLADVSDGAMRFAQTVRAQTSTLQRIKQDFRAVRDAGFRVGRICGFEEPTDHSIVSASIRVSKLGLPQETQEAWNLASSDYIVLLIQYTGAYLTFDDVMERPAGESSLKFRLRRCARYRPTYTQATTALSTGTNKLSASTAVTSEDAGLSLLGIGESIDMLLEKDFIPLLKIRRQENTSWDTAMKFHKELVKASSLDKMPPSAASTQESDDVNLPPSLSKDHLSSHGEISLPLVATQCALRYLVKCTDYCLICHDKVEESLEVVKPYVCGNSLCLFQYMSLGFGPSTDHEIIAQPYVVDLLISFCYASLTPSDRSRIGIREFPVGLSLQVPRIQSNVVFPVDQMPANTLLGSLSQVITSTLKPRTTPQPNKVILKDIVLFDPLVILFDWDASTVQLIDPDLYHSGLREGKWVVICTPLHSEQPGTTTPGYQESKQQVLHHGRITRRSGGVLDLDVVFRHVMPPGSIEADEAMVGTHTVREPIPGHLVFCDQNLDDLSKKNKVFPMKLLLSTLPSVTEMRAYLLESRTRRLATWKRMLPSAMGLLRWIIASNRSYILQVDKCPSQDTDASNGNVARSEERITGVDGWLQFRFAQGSPEKEALFRQVIKTVNKKQPSLVAWHGSPLGNWHSIIRQGLNYVSADHGRAYGDGVYFSQQFETSLGYTYPMGTIATKAGIWPPSALKITSAISLNELVNLPEQFRNSRGCFVVQHCHWIQCRYLFVLPQSNATVTPMESSTRRPSEEFKQDSRWVTHGPGGRKLYIPRIAIPSTQERQRVPSGLILASDGKLPEDSDDEDIEDREFLADDNTTEMLSGTHDVSKSTWDARKASVEPAVTTDLPITPTQSEPPTDFRPGTLDLSNLQMLSPPLYATEAAQKFIARELRVLQKAQSSTPIHELGWYIDFDSIRNMFQWIVELHSFDAQLPLARDMKKSGITSIVLEVRFLRGFPMSPPFVRVIQPRFLPFMNGGGGHVTSGGAMCMELLTNTGWSPANSLESVLLQVRLAICSLDPRPARLEPRGGHVPAQYSRYNIGEAVEAYRRAAAVHGWEVPKDLLEATTSL